LEVTVQEIISDYFENACCILLIWNEIMCTYFLFEVNICEKFHQIILEFNDSGIFSVAQFSFWVLSWTN
jgi:hypothetical protein